jgi:alpha-ketoglutarate-dependent taurine dioxygenase
MSLEYTVLDNGWAIQVHSPFLSLSDQDLEKVLELVLKNTIVIWKGQTIKPEDIMNFSNSFGDHGFAFNTKEYDLYTDFEKSKFVGRDYSGLIRVSGKKDNNGYSGVFGHKEELSWHIDRAYHPDRKPITLLYSVKGSNGSVTRFTNHMLAYDSIPNKEIYKGMKLKFGMGRWRTESIDDLYKTTSKTAEKTEKISHDLVISNPYGTPGLNISPLQVESIDGMTYEEMISFTDLMLDYLTQDRFTYSHYWEDGDIVLSEQIFGMHKRDAYQNIEERVLYRIGFNTRKIKPDLKYEGYNGTF